MCAAVLTQHRIAKCCQLLGFYDIPQVHHEIDLCHRLRGCWNITHDDLTISLHRWPGEEHPEQHGALAAVHDVPFFVAVSTFVMQDDRRARRTGKTSHINDRHRHAFDIEVHTRM